MMISRSLHTLALLFAAFLLSACNEDKLLNNLTQEQANQVVSILQQHNISAYKDGALKSGYTVTVQKSENTAALSIINQYQLPWGSDIQIADAFPDNALVSSPNAEMSRILSMQEQRLEQSLRLISQVVNARVHVSYPAFNQDVVNKNLMRHVGVLISYKGEIDDNMFITQIKTLVKNSFENVSFENISVALFPSPPIQYASPTAVPASTPLPWIIFFSALTLCILAVTCYVLYNFILNKPTEKDNPPAVNVKEDDEP